MKQQIELVLTNNSEFRLPTKEEAVLQPSEQVCLIDSGFKCAPVGDPCAYAFLGIKGGFKWWYNGYRMLEWAGNVVEVSQKTVTPDLYEKVRCLSALQCNSREWIYFGVLIEKKS